MTFYDEAIYQIDKNNSLLFLKGALICKKFTFVFCEGEFFCCVFLYSIKLKLKLYDTIMNFKNIYGYVISIKVKKNS